MEAVGGGKGSHVVMSKRDKNERPADIIFWCGDGQCGRYRARIKAEAEVSIGRTDSKRALGFIVTNGDQQVDFVLNRDQVAELAAYLDLFGPGLRKPLGRKPDQISWVAVSKKLAESRSKTERGGNRSERRRRATVGRSLAAVRGGAQQVSRSSRCRSRTHQASAAIQLIEPRVARAPKDAAEVRRDVNC